MHVILSTTWVHRDEMGWPSPLFMKPSGELWLWEKKALLTQFPLAMCSRGDLFATPLHVLSFSIHACLAASATLAVGPDAVVREKRLAASLLKGCHLGAALLPDPQGWHDTS